MGIVQQIAQLCKDAGGRALLVGGCVRDEVMGLEPKDFDLEVYALEPERVRGIVGSLGHVSEVGVAFGVLKLTVDGQQIDVSLPRRDSKTGDGHKDFAVSADPSMSIAEAARRRDFTFNSLAKDPLTGEVIDEFGGVEDAKNRILRVTDPEHFREDPLRVLRAVQFAGRFALHVEPFTFSVMRQMVVHGDLKHLPKERLREEWAKLFGRSQKPSRGLQLALSLGIFDEFPAIANMMITLQEPEFHPEGDVWTHTKMVADAAAGEDDLVVKIAAFCHDFGKASTTETVDGRIRSHGHDDAGVPLAAEWLKAIGFQDLVDLVCPIVADHLTPTMLYQRRDEIRSGAIKRLARRIAPATVEQLVAVARADHLGRGPFPLACGVCGNYDSHVARCEHALDEDTPVEDWQRAGGPPREHAAGDWLLGRANELGVSKAPSETVIRGRDLIALGLRPGPLFGRLIAEAEERHLETGATREELLVDIRTAVRSLGFCPRCGAEMKPGIALQNASKPMSCFGPPGYLRAAEIVNVEKCTGCGHSYGT